VITSLFALFLVVLVVGAFVFGLGGGVKRSGFRFSDIFKFSGEVGRGTYAAVGIIGLALKHNIDRAVAALVFERSFGVFNYWVPPVDAVRLTALSRADALFLATMVCISIPFIWVGLGMTVRRLRSAGLPLWLVALFFLPVLNIVFFLILSLVPPAASIREPRSGPSGLGQVIPESVLGSALLSVISISAIGAAIAYLGVEKIGSYGWGVFVALPFCLGLTSVMVYSFHRPRSMRSCVLVSITAVGLAALLLFAFAVEGLICILMAIPIAAPLAFLGGIVGFLIQRARPLQTQMNSFLLIIAIVPAGFIGVEGTTSVTPALNMVETSMRINAPASTIWQNLIAFPDLPGATALMFRAGVAHPIHATIDGEGVGATRACLFSTGTFIERIDGWEKEKRMAFSIVSNADAMHEWSPYNIHPRHLDGYFNPVKAEFTLTANADGSTTLRGKSWYRNAMWPGMYWRVWSDKILHDVHRSVFEHIRELSEKETEPQ
jgi:uncharacterized membrane protein YhaH (DUF805 family)